MVLHLSEDILLFSNEQNVIGDEFVVQRFDQGSALAPIYWHISCSEMRQIFCEMYQICRYCFGWRFWTMDINSRERITEFHVNVVESISRLKIILQLEN